MTYENICGAECMYDHKLEERVYVTVSVGGSVHVIERNRGECMCGESVFVRVYMRRFVGSGRVYF